VLVFEGFPPKGLWDGRGSLTKERGRGEKHHDRNDMSHAALDGRS
jgi:hypothetical protein